MGRVYWKTRYHSLIIIDNIPHALHLVSLHHCLLVEQSVGKEIVVIHKVCVFRPAERGQRG